MNEHDFCLWLQGFAELNTQPPTPEQWQSIREHLQTVFKKVTPPLNIHPVTTPYPAFAPGIAEPMPNFPHPTNIGTPDYGPGIIC
jgi:hypothetical protein